MSGIIVSGAFGTLGRAVVSELKQRGWPVAAIDIAPAPSDLSADIVIGGIDLLEETAVRRAYAEATERLGGLSGLVNLAGGFLWEKIADGYSDSWERMFLMNLQSTATSCRVALPSLTAAGRAAIVNVGAAAANRPGVGMAPYATSKAGVMALTESLAEELRDRRISVNAVQPTILDTPANRADMPSADRRHWVPPEAAAKVIGFLLSLDAAPITGTGIPLSKGD